MDELKRMIYVVTAGNYSDYHIEGLFSTMELAKDYVDRFNALGNYDKAEVETYEVDEEVGSENRTVYRVFLDKDGNKKHEFDTCTRFVPARYTHRVTWGVATNDPIHVGEATTLDLAYKVAAEERQAYLRETQGDRSQAT